MPSPDELEEVGDLLTRNVSECLNYAKSLEELAEVVTRLEGSGYFRRRRNLVAELVRDAKQHVLYASETLDTAAGTLAKFQTAKKEEDA